MAEPLLSPPSSAQLRHHLFIVLGTLTDWKARVFVDHKKVVDAVIRAAGFDPDNLAQYGDPAAGWRLDGGHSDMKSFGRRIWNAFRRSYHLRNPALTVCGPVKGQWGLTDAGLERARSLAGLSNVGNATSLFLDRRLRETGGLKGSFWRTLQAAVAVKFPISNQAGLLDDHIQTCMMRLIQRDALRERIATGMKITDTHIATYVVRSAINDCRDAATEPLTRELYGARTAKERKEGKHLLDSANPARITWDADEGRWDDIVDPVPMSAVENKIDIQVIWRTIERAVQQRQPDHWQTYMKIIQMRSEGHSLRDIASNMELDLAQAHVMMMHVRECLGDVWDSNVMDGILKRNHKISRATSMPSAGSSDGDDLSTSTVASGNGVTSLETSLAI